MNTKQKDLQNRLGEMLSYFSITGFLILVIIKHPDLIAGWAALVVSTSSLLATSIRMAVLIKKKKE